MTELEEALTYYDGNAEMPYCDLVYAALKKQQARKPVFADEQDVRYSMNYVCPACQKNFSGTGIAQYCYHCGQALDWGE